jgi:hypothetical protein
MIKLIWVGWQHHDWEQLNRGAFNRGSSRLRLNHVLPKHGSHKMVSSRYAMAWRILLPTPAATPHEMEFSDFLFRQSEDYPRVKQGWLSRKLSQSHGAIKVVNGMKMKSVVNESVQNSPLISCAI